MYGRYEPEIERTYSKDDLFDRIDYNLELQERKTQSKPKSKRKASTSRASKSRTRKGVRK